MSRESWTIFASAFVVGYDVYDEVVNVLLMIYALHEE